MKNNNKDMTTGRPIKLLLAFALPVFIDNLFQQIYTVADTAIVSQTLGADALAAVGSIGAVNFLILGFCNGMGMGFAIPISQRFGARDREGMKKYAGNAVWLYLLLSSFCAVISVLLCRNILEWTRTPAEIIDQAYAYLVVIFLGIPAMFAYNTLASMMRALGDSKTPLYIMMVTSVLNIVLDLVCILVFGLGTAGAALATVISEIVSVIACLVCICTKIPELQIGKEHLCLEKHYVYDLLKNGAPMALQMSITGIGSIILQTSVNVLGALSIAAVTAAERIGNLMSVPLSSLAGAMSVYCGQNMGAGKAQRITNGVKTGVSVGMIFSVLAGGSMALFGKQMALVFLDSGSLELIEMAYTYLLSIACFLWAQSLIFTVRFSIQGLGFGIFALIACVLEMIARSAFGLYFIPKYGFQAAGFSSPAAWVMADMFLIPSLIWICKRKLKVVPEHIQQ